MDNSSLCLLRINGQLIDRESTSCTGKQLKELLVHVEPWVCLCDWYLLDVRINNYVEFLGSSGQHLQRISRKILDSICAQVDQFLSGVFLAVPSSVSQPKLHLDTKTEDEPSLDLGDALLEIRAFDTSYFEIYTPLPALAERLHQLFGVEVEQSP